MKHSRRRLLLVPLALLGAALLVRSRLSRPQAEGDQWLWEQAEKAHFIGVSFGDNGRYIGQRFGLKPREAIFISDRQGMRDLLRSLEGTPPFKPVPRRPAQGIPKVAFISLPLSYGAEVIYFDHTSRGDFIYHVNTITNSRFVAPLKPESKAHFLDVLHKVVIKAQRDQSDYSIYNRIQSSYSHFDPHG